MVLINPTPPRPQAADYLRAVAYFSMMVWTVLFAVFPPVAYLNSTDVVTRLLWIGGCFAGALFAFIGAVTRRDLKVEFSGLVFMGIGPLFYSAAQVYYIINPLPGTDAHARIALSVYVLIPLLLTLPRIFELYSEAQRAKHLRMNADALKKTGEK